MKWCLSKFGSWSKCRNKGAEILLNPNFHQAGHSWHSCLGHFRCSLFGALYSALWSSLRHFSWKRFVFGKTNSLKKLWKIPPPFLFFKTWFLTEKAKIGIFSFLEEKHWLIPLYLFHKLHSIPFDELIFALPLILI